MFFYFPVVGQSIHTGNIPVGYPERMIVLRDGKILGRMPGQQYLELFATQEQRNQWDPYKLWFDDQPENNREDQQDNKVGYNQAQKTRRPPASRIQIGGETG